MKISVVIPVHNETSRLPAALRTLIAWGQADEIILVENGSTDGTQQMAYAAQYAYPRLIRAMHIVGRGKGAAVRIGMLEARGDYRIMADVDLATPPAAWDALLGYDVAVGQRVHPQKLPVSRHITGRVFRLLVDVLFPELSNVPDTQSGFKAFSARAAMQIFVEPVIPGMAFDVQILSRAVAAGYDIHSVPVPWVHDPDSRVRLDDPLEMARALWRLRRENAALSPVRG